MATDDIEDTYDAGELLGDILLGRLVNGQTDEALRARLDRWLKEHPEVQEDLGDLHDPNQLKALIDRYREISASTPRAYKNFLSQTPEHRRPIRIYYYLSGAAAVLLLTFSIALFVRHRSPAGSPPMAQVQNDLAPGTSKAVLTLAGGNSVVLDSAHNGLIQQQGSTRIINQVGGLLSYQSVNSNHNPQLYNTITTGRGGEYRVVLSDGTKVWLDAASSLHYPTAFTGATREVTLTGQGYFEVAHHKEPFTVHVGNTNILDLATAFNVNAYPEAGGVVTTLLEGAVRVGVVTLRPGQQLSGGSQVISDVDTDEVVAWKEGRTQFTDVPFSTVLQCLSRWYDVNIVDKTGLNQKVVLSVPRDVPISVLMKAFEKTNRIRYTIEGKTMTVELNQ